MPKPNFYLLNYLSKKNGVPTIVQPTVYYNPNQTLAYQIVDVRNDNFMLLNYAKLVFYFSRTSKLMMLIQKQSK
jgi:hypothetical protein